MDPAKEREKVSQPKKMLLDSGFESTKELSKTYHHFVNRDIRTERNRGPDKCNRSHTPIAVEVGAVEIQFCLSEGIQAQYLDFLLCQVASCKDAQQGRLSTSIGSDQQASGAGLESQIQILQYISFVELVQGASAAVTECQIIDFDRIRTVVFDCWKRLWDNSLLLHCHCGISVFTIDPLWR